MLPLSDSPNGARGGRRARLLELLRFAIVGGFSTVLYFGAYSGLILVGLPYGVASFLGWAASVTFGFVMHHRFTFRTGHDGFTAGAGFSRWFGLQTVVLGLNFLGLSVLVHGLDVPRIASQLILLPFIPLLTFVLSRRFVFAAPDAAATDSDTRLVQ